MLKMKKDNTDRLRHMKSKFFKKITVFSLFSKQYLQIYKTIAYCNNAQNTKKLQTIIHIEIEVT